MLALLLLLLAQTPADARSRAEVLFQEGRRLMDAGKTPEACARFAESLALDAAAGTLLNLAVCHERAGLLDRAWLEATEVADLARKDGNAERLRFAEQLRAELDRRLGLVTVTLQPGAAVRLDGAPVAGDRPVPLAPGKHELVASADGRVPWTLTFQIEAGARLALAVPPLALVPQATPPAPAPLPPARPALTTRRTVSLALGGAALAAIATGATFGAMALSRGSASDARCPQGPSCTDATGVRLSKDARSAALVADVTLGAGVALAAAATYLWLSDEAEPNARLAAVPLLGGGALTVAGRF